MENPNPNEQWQFNAPLDFGDENTIQADEEANDSSSNDAKKNDVSLSPRSETSQMSQQFATPTANGQTPYNLRSTPIRELNKQGHTPCRESRATKDFGKRTVKRSTILAKNESTQKVNNSTMEKIDAEQPMNDQPMNQSSSRGSSYIVHSPEIHQVTVSDDSDEAQNITPANDSAEAQNITPANDSDEAQNITPANDSDACEALLSPKATAIVRMSLNTSAIITEASSSNLKPLEPIQDDKTVGLEKIILKVSELELEDKKKKKTSVRFNLPTANQANVTKKSEVKKRVYSFPSTESARNFMDSLRNDSPMDRYRAPHSATVAVGPSFMTGSLESCKSCKKSFKSCKCSQA